MCREAEKPRMIAETDGEVRLARGLSRRPHEAGDQDERAPRPSLGRLAGDLEHRPQQTDLANGELRRVDTDREAARAGVDVVARKRPLPAQIELALHRQCERMRRNGDALGNQLDDRRGQIGDFRCQCTILNQSVSLDAGPDLVNLRCERPRRLNGARSLSRRARAPTRSSTNQMVDKLERLKSLRAVKSKMRRSDFGPAGGGGVSAYDGLILGAGHNGLILAAYLAKAGLRVLLVERRAGVGGGAETFEDPRHPGFLHNTHAFFQRAITTMPWYARPRA